MITSIFVENVSSMYINISYKVQRIADTQFHFITKFHNLTGQPSYIPLFNDAHNKKEVNMIRKYHNYTAQTNPQQCEEETQNISINKTIKAKQPVFSSSLRRLQNEKRHKVMPNKTKTNTEPPQTTGCTLNNRSTTTEPPP